MMAPASRPAVLPSVRAVAKVCLGRWFLVTVEALAAGDVAAPGGAAGPAPRTEEAFVVSRK
jgi:hypothetical protein